MDFESLLYSNVNRHVIYRKHAHLQHNPSPIYTTNVVQHVAPLLSHATPSKKSPRVDLQACGTKAQSSKQLVQLPVVIAIISGHKSSSQPPPIIRVLVLPTPLPPFSLVQYPIEHPPANRTHKLPALHI